MPQLSRRPISQELLSRMSELLWKSIIKLNNPKTVKAYLDDILTPTERVMIAKRLAMAILLFRGWDYDSICRYLKVSTSTVAILKSRLLTGSPGYRHVINQIESDKEWEQIWLDLQQGFEEVIAGRVGANWKVSKKEHYQKFKTKRRKYKIL